MASLGHIAIGMAAARVFADRNGGASSLVRATPLKHMVWSMPPCPVVLNESDRVIVDERGGARGQAMFTRLLAGPGCLLRGRQVFELTRRCERG